MKKPYYNLEERGFFCQNKMQGAFLSLYFELIKLNRFFIYFIKMPQTINWLSKNIC